MWLCDNELDDWFQEVERKRKEKYGITDDETDSADTGVMAQNEYAKGLRD